MFEDTQLEGLLELNNGRVRLAAADAVEAIAFSEALISKVITTEDLQTDGAKVATAMLAKARQLRDADDHHRRRKASDRFQLVRFRPVPTKQFRRMLSSSMHDPPSILDGYTGTGQYLSGLCRYLSPSPDEKKDPPCGTRKREPWREVPSLCGRVRHVFSPTRIGVCAMWNPGQTHN